MRITFYGHACVGLELGGKKLLFDPFIRPNALAGHIKVEDIEADYILLSHGHADHVADAEEIAKRTGATLISNYEVVSWFSERGVEKNHPMNLGGRASFDFGTVKMVNAIHSSTMPDGSYGGNPGGFIIKGEGRCVYFAGDTALHKDMELIGRYDTPDVAILPIGDNFTMGVEDSIYCSEMIKCKTVVAMHFNTFPYIAIDTDAAKEAYRRENRELIVLSIGESKEF